MTDPIHKADDYGKARKEVRRARHPEVKTKFPPSKRHVRKPWGISYRWNSIFRKLWGDSSTQPKRFRWFETERGRDQALKHMKRGYDLPGGKVHHIYKDVEKIKR